MCERILASPRQPRHPKVAGISNCMVNKTLKGSKPRAYIHVVIAQAVYLKGLVWCSHTEVETVTSPPPFASQGDKEVGSACDSVLKCCAKALYQYADAVVQGRRGSSQKISVVIQNLSRSSHLMGGPVAGPAKVSLARITIDAPASKVRCMC